MGRRTVCARRKAPFHRGTRAELSNGQCAVVNRSPISPGERLDGTENTSARSCDRAEALVERVRYGRSWGENPAWQAFRGTAVAVATTSSGAPSSGCCALRFLGESSR